VSQLLRNQSLWINSSSTVHLTVNYTEKHPDRTNNLYNYNENEKTTELTHSHVYPSFN
jgi:hypothetical protein